MLRKFKILLPIIFVVSLFTSFQTNANTDPKDKVLMTILKYVLTQGHYLPKEIDDDFSEKVYDSFLEKLDPSKRYFLQEDIDEFSLYKKQIDDQINSEDLSFFFLVYNRLTKRIEESKPYYHEILSQPFDFEKNETMDVDYKKATYSKNVHEVKSVWKRQLKFSTLSRLHDKLTAEKDKKKEDKTYTIKSFKELEKEARGATLDNMDEFFVRIEELTYSDWFSTFINSISEKFDPHTTYFDPTVKKRFDISMAVFKEPPPLFLKSSTNPSTFCFFNRSISFAISVVEFLKFFSSKSI